MEDAVTTHPTQGLKVQTIRELGWGHNLARQKKQKSCLLICFGNGAVGQGGESEEELFSKKKSWGGQWIFKVRDTYNILKAICVATIFSTVLIAHVSL